MAGNSKKNLLPKRIAGVKVPKSVRRGRIAEAIASPTGREVLAELMVAAAAAAKAMKDNPATRSTLTDVADRLRDDATKTEAAKDGEGKDGAKAAKLTEEASAAVTYAMGEAARAFVDALNRRRATAGEEKAQSGEGWTDPPEPMDSKKKPSSYEGVPH